MKELSVTRNCLILLNIKLIQKNDKAKYLLVKKLTFVGFRYKVLPSLLTGLQDRKLSLEVMIMINDIATKY